MDAKTIIAKRVAKEIKDGDFINLGIGIPTMVVNYIPSDMKVVLHSENGFIGLGPTPEPDKADKDISNAGGQPASIVPGGMFFDCNADFHEFCRLFIERCHNGRAGDCHRYDGGLLNCRFGKLLPSQG